MTARKIERVSVTHAWWVEETRADYESNVFGTTAGLGSGKTHGHCQIHHDRCILNRDSPFSAFMMPIYQKIHDAAIPTYRQVLSDYGLTENVHFKFVKSPYPKLVYLDSGHEVHFISGNRPDKIVGVQYSHATISESGSTEQDAYRLLRTRIRHPAAQYRQLFCEGAPQGNQGWFADTFDSDNQEGWNRSVTRDHLKVNTNKFTGEKTLYRRFRVRTYDNSRFLPVGYISDLYDIYSYNPNYLEAYIEGKFCPLVEGNCYHNYKPTLHDIEDVEPDPHIDIQLTFDFNANPISWTSLQKKRFEDYDGKRLAWVATYEASGDAQDLEDASVDFAIKHPVSRFRHTPIYIYGDSSGHASTHRSKRTDYEEIRYQLKALGYTKVVIKALKYNPLETVSIAALNKWLGDYEIFISKRCKDLRRSLLATRYKEGLRKIEKKAGETHTHPSDNLKYFAYAQQQHGGPKIITRN